MRPFGPEKDVTELVAEESRLEARRRRQEARLYLFMRELVPPMTGAATMYCGRETSDMAIYRVAGQPKSTKTGAWLAVSRGYKLWPAISIFTAAVDVRSHEIIGPRQNQLSIRPRLFEYETGNLMGLSIVDEIGYDVDISNREAVELLEQGFATARIIKRQTLPGSTPGNV